MSNEVTTNLLGSPNPRQRKWVYKSEVIAGNLHDAAHFINRYHQEWDVVAMDSDGNYTSVVYREEITNE